MRSGSITDLVHRRSPTARRLQGPLRREYFQALHVPFYDCATDLLCRTVATAGATTVVEEATATATTTVVTDAGTTTVEVTATAGTAMRTVAAATAEATPAATTVRRVAHLPTLSLADMEALATHHHRATTRTVRVVPTTKREVKVGSLD